MISNSIAIPEKIGIAIIAFKAGEMFGARKVRMLSTKAKAFVPVSFPFPTPCSTHNPSFSAANEALLYRLLFHENQMSDSTRGVETRNLTGNPVSL